MDSLQQDRRMSDRRKGGKHRCPTSPPNWIIPSWRDQRLQYVMRYLFTLLGLVYFNHGFEYRSEWLSLAQMNGFFVGYLLWISLTLFHAYRYPCTVTRFRITMWSDIFGIGLVVLHDPFAVPLTSLVWIVIALGNGMRYGIRCFSEALIGCFFIASLTLLLKFSNNLDQVLSGVIFLATFGGLILIYAYLLMQRIHIAQRRIERQSRTDPLTQLLNRGALISAGQAMIDHALRERYKVVVMFADLDRFKTINDRLGHRVGDQVLVKVAHILRETIRETDIAARYGGDEFVLVLDEVDADTAQGIGQRLQHQIEQWAAEQGHDLGVSIGIGEVPTHGSDILALLHQVDQTMYRSKHAAEGAGIALVEACAGA